MLIFAAIAEENLEGVLGKTICCVCNDFAEMKLTIWGAAQQVTGSMHLLELDNGYKILIDCGLDYEQKQQFFYNPNAEFPFNPEEINLVVLTHAHIDHSGNIPNLIRQGFSGKIFCTPATAELTDFLLMDSANIQKAEIRKSRSKSKSKRGKAPAIQPLYTQKHVMDALDRFLTVEFNKPFEIQPGTTITFIEAGHLLGAASALVNTTSNGKPLRIGFTGDLGKNGSKLIRDAQVMPDLDYLVCESTYGARHHKVTRSAEDELSAYIEETCVAIRGRLVIPAFSVGRTQSIIFTLNQLHQAGKLPPIRVFVDSPLAIRSTHVYSRYPRLLNEEAHQFSKQHGNLFEFENLYEAMDNYDSEEIKYYYEPCVIISAAGMVEGGRIQEHVLNNIQNPHSTILIAGFCAEGTLGHRLLQGQPTIHIKNKERAVFARIAATDVFSAHPDQSGLMEYLGNSIHKGLKKVFLVHGEGTAMETLKSKVSEESGI